MTRWTIGLATAALLLGATACDDPIETPTPIKFDGEVHELSLPGPSTWVIDRLDSDISYYPFNLPAAYEVEGRQADFEAILVHEFTVYDREPIEILDISDIGL